jgi:hypothetical protein
MLPVLLLKECVAYSVNKAVTFSFIRCYNSSRPYKYSFQTFFPYRKNRDTHDLTRGFQKEKTVDEIIAIEREGARKTGDHPHPLEAHFQWLHDAGF